MATIDLSNYANTLHQSTASRAGSPDGNVFFNKASGLLEYIDATELASYTPSAATSATTLGTTAPDLITRSAGSFLTDGWRAGMQTTLGGSTTQNGTYEIESISADGQTITTVETSISTEAGSGDETLAGALTTNALIEADGIKFEGIYAFENQERRLDEDLRKYDRWTSGTFKFGGAYNYVNGRAPATDVDRSIKRGSGWNEFNASAVALRKYFGLKGLANIEATSQPYFQQDVQGTSTDFTELGQIDEAILVYHDSNGDGTPDTVNKITYAAASVRTYGQNHDRKETTTDLGIAELGGYSTGIALNESVHLTTSEATYPIANVYNSTRASQTSPWTNMELRYVASPVAKTGEFDDETGSRLFSWELYNPLNASLDQCVAWLDAFALNSDEAAGAGGDANAGHLGRDIETWYSYNASGQIVTKSGVDPSTEGMFIQSVPANDNQRILQTDDGGTQKAYTFLVQVEAEVGATAKADTLSWYHAFEAALYNASGAVTLQDSTPADVKGLSSTADGSNKIIFSRAYSSDLDCVFVCEGDGGATQAKTLFTISNNATIAFACIPSAENNV